MNALDTMDLDPLVGKINGDGFAMTVRGRENRGDPGFSSLVLPKMR